MTYSPTYFLPNWKILLVAVVLSLTPVLADQSSTSARTNGFFGPSAASLEASNKAADRNVGATKARLRKAQRDLDKLERQLARDERRLRSKKMSKSGRAKIESRIKRRKPALSSAQREFKLAKRARDRALRAQARAVRARERVQRRVEATERRAALAEQRRAARSRSRTTTPTTPTSDSTPLAFASGLFSRNASTPQIVGEYGARRDGGFKVSAVPVNKMDKRLLRQEVRYRSRHKPGTIIVDPGAKYLYLVQPGGTAMRYGIGVGKSGFEWSGSAHVGWKQQWPKWTPPEEMIARRPDLRKSSADNGGMPGGPKNPLGARALYLMQGGVDTLYRLHGTPQWNSIGTAASSGCIRLMNQDIIDLYKRVPQGAKVVVM